MRNMRMVCLTVLVVTFMVGCSGSNDTDENIEVAKSQELPKGFEGGCIGDKKITLYIQNQFEPYGAKGRYDLDASDQGPTLDAGKEFRSTGWFDTGESLAPSNPELIRGEVWYYIPELNAWLADMSVRSKSGIPQAVNDDSKFTPDQAVPRPKECELTR